MQYYIFQLISREMYYPIHVREITVQWWYTNVQHRLAEINDNRTIENNLFLNQMDNERQQRLNFEFVNSSRQIWRSNFERRICRCCEQSHQAQKIISNSFSYPIEKKLEARLFCELCHRLFVLLNKKKFKKERKHKGTFCE